MRKLTSLLAAIAAAMTALPALAQDGLEIIGRPVDSGIGFQPAATELARDIQWLDGMILVIITAITIFVTVLLAVCIVRYNRKSNPEPATFTHNSPLEVAWTVEIFCENLKISEAPANEWLPSGVWIFLDFVPHIQRSST